MKKWNLRLNLFDGGEGASAPAAGEASVTGVATGTEVGAEGTDTADTTQTGDTDRPSFKDLISGDYKAEADEYIQGIIRKRVRDSKQDKETIAKQAEILNTVAAKYGMDASDLAALQEKVSADDAYIEEAAMEEGLTTDQYRRIRDAEAKAAAYEAHMAEAERERATQQKVAEWQAEAERVKQVYPDFDLATELENPTFQKQLRLGIDMQSAYVALHQAEILQGAMRVTAQEVRRATANDIAARGQRPRENASSARSAATVRTDVSKLTRADREALSRRALSGEIITLG